ncbi:MAG: BtrH N-terminal domain-containing protein [Deltaproteobacteria bacterium]|nr:BtrH N-terminal domain-containing protein [Deltaproteobacteria bacterium]
MIESYRHQVAAHCETGSTRNLLNHVGLPITEPMVFGLGSGPAFFYLFFTRTPKRFPFVALRNPPGKVLRNNFRMLGVEGTVKCHRTTREAMEEANRLIDDGIPVMACVDMFYMRYLPAFMHIHAPFHFVVLMGRDGDTYAVSDPYHEPVGRLSAEDLALAWDIRAPFSKGNLIAYVRSVPNEHDWRRIAAKAIGRTCRNMILPPLVRKGFFFVGIEGMKTYSRRMTTWPRDYRGVALREGILLSAVGFEDQGTGGGAFRLLYGAFLQELAQLLDERAFEGLADRIIEHGQNWRRFSGRLIALGKRVPMKEEAFDAFWKSEAASFEKELRELSDRFAEFAFLEERFLIELRAAARRL